MFLNCRFSIICPFVATILFDNGNDRYPLVVGAGLTVTCTSSVPVLTKLSVTVNLNIYTPCVRLDTVVVADVELPNVNETGPLILLHEYPATVPSVSVPLPDSVVLLMGSVIVLSAPALAVGGIFVGGGVTGL
jgi:hypothetical protein